LDETRFIASLWEGSNAGATRPLRSPGDDAGTLLTGSEATESAFKARAPGRRVIHLATHGFFLGGRCPSRLERPLASGRAGGGDRAAIGENPLLLSGLALAGANRRERSGAEDDDGILTAEEIAALDLSGVEWAVLSACETGAGEVRAGEGVLGLRRAFQVAGARTLIMSLWTVDDDATSRWMQALYEARLRRRQGTMEAVRHASLALLRERRQKGQSTHPFYWGAFVAAGRWE
jgi:CHAT domain-containing protein